MLALRIIFPVIVTMAILLVAGCAKPGVSPQRLAEIRAMVETARIYRPDHIYTYNPGDIYSDPTTGAAMQRAYRYNDMALSAMQRAAAAAEVGDTQGYLRAQRESNYYRAARDAAIGY